MKNCQGEGASASRTGRKHAEYIRPVGMGRRANEEIVEGEDGGERQFCSGKEGIKSQCRKCLLGEKGTRMS